MGGGAGAGGGDGERDEEGDFGGVGGRRLSLRSATNEERLH